MSIQPKNPVRRPPDRVTGIEIYLKGSCLTNPGPAGYAGVILSPGGRWSLQSSASPWATNNQAEIHAAILALKSLPQPSVATIYSNSLYLVNQGNEIWSVSTNLALWKELTKLLQVHQASFVHVPKASAHPLIELARAQAKASILQIIPAPARTPVGTPAGTHLHEPEIIDIPAPKTPKARTRSLKAPAQRTTPNPTPDLAPAS